MKELIQYIKSPTINISAICRECKINTGQMSGMLNGDRNFTSKHVWNVMKMLARPGMVLAGHRIDYHDGSFTHQKIDENRKILAQEVLNDAGFPHTAYYVPMERGTISEPLEMIIFLEKISK